MENSEEREKILLEMTDMQKALCQDFCELANRVTSENEEFEDDPDLFFDTAWKQAQEHHDQEMMKSAADFIQEKQ